MLDPKVCEPAAIRDFSDHCLETEKKMTHRVSHYEKKSLHELLKDTVKIEDSVDLSPEYAS